jgi:hypothetical protein
MIGNYFARLTGSKRNLLALLASSVAFTAGCANMSSTAPMGANPFISPATLSGKIHGGNQPVIGATVTLWFAGQSGPATLAATATSDSLGSFAFTKDAVNGNAADTGTTSTYSCPMNTDPLVYVLSKGGNTQNNGVIGQTNTAAAFIAIYDTCSKLSASNFVFLSEVTSVATIAAAQQFFNPVDDSLTADGTGQEKIIIDNVSKSAALLADPATGLFVPSTVIPAASGSGTNIAPGVSLTATPETGKVNLLANIISSCVNGATAAAPACTSLFSAAVPPIPNTTTLNPPSFAPATDTLQALFYMFTNPTNGSGSTGTANLATLFGLAGGVGAPYQPSAPQPTDWTIGINYASSSTCGSAGGFINSPVDVSIDAQDNVWIANSQTGGNLSAISSTGAPITCINLDAGASAGGGTIDSAGNVWFGAGTTLYRYTANTKAILTFPVTVSPLGIAADGVGNVYFTAVSGGTGSLYKLPLGATTGTAVLPVQISNLVGPNPVRLMPDFTGIVAGVPNPVDIWVSSGAGFVSQVTPSSATGNLNGFITTTFPTSGSSYGLSVGRGSVFTSALDTGDITQLVFTGTTWVPAGGWSPLSSAVATAAGISSPTALSVDGRQNVWTPNNTNGTGTGSVSSISVDATALSPSTGFQKASTFLNSGRALAVDQAGNVWIVGDGNSFVTEIVGGAVPLYQPYAAGLANGRFQSIP